MITTTQQPLLHLPYVAGGLQVSRVAVRAPWESQTGITSRNKRVRSSNWETLQRHYLHAGAMSCHALPFDNQQRTNTMKMHRMHGAPPCQGCDQRALVPSMQQSNQLQRLHLRAARCMHPGSARSCDMRDPRAKHHFDAACADGMVQAYLHNGNVRACCVGKQAGSKKLRCSPVALARRHRQPAQHVQAGRLHDR